ncbi:MAG: transglutaminase-like domain-containing protein [Bacteroidales bacterium]|jgi:hypothetical protein
MKIRNFFLPLLILIAISLSSCKDHFLKDTNYRNTVEEDYQKRAELANRRAETLFSVMDNATLEEKEALKFLYAYMPYSDLADYSGEYFLNQVRGAFRARDYFSWGNTIPEDIFRHFVLVYRVNNENLDSARDVIFEELKDRIKDMSMYDAALEVNHWCHEKVTYKPSDSRTSSSLATIKTAYGRCGEESTFTVTAMRAVGIPARQCYTPRWAHTDDNHAWVEVWVDGKWYYLGACEPEPELDMGWFSIPSTRCMMVHSNVYGKYKGDEEVNYQSDLFSRVNMLSNYTKTKKIKVIVTDSADNKVENATVKFKLYNYAEYYPIASAKTDKNGEAFLTTGYGDLLIWAYKDGIYNYEKIDVREQDDITIKLLCTGRENFVGNIAREDIFYSCCEDGDEYVKVLDINPPIEGKRAFDVPQEKIDENNRSLAYEDSIRNAYLASFPTKEDAAKIESIHLSPERVWHYISMSQGNYKEIEKFIKQNNKDIEGLFLDEFLAGISEKDVREMPADVLQSHVVLYDKNASYPKEVFIKGILPARIQHEYIRPWRQFLNEKMTMELDGNITSKSLIDWINENITISRDGNYYNCPISPKGVYELRHSDKTSRNIFFVAACRSLNIPSYRDNATGKIYVYENDNWIPISFEIEEPKNNTSTLVLHNNTKGDIKPQYWIHYTLAKFEDGDFYTFDFEDDDRVANFPVTLDLEPGYYMLSTGNRYSDGTTKSRLEFFNLYDGETLNKEIILLDLTPRDEDYGTINIENKININGNEVTLKEYMDGKSLILGFLNPTQEPTKHLMKDIAMYTPQFNKAQAENIYGKMLFLIPSDKETKTFKLSDWDLPNQTTLIVDEDSQLLNEILTSTDQYFRENFPLVFIVQPDGKLTFKTEGYRIGSGQLIYNSL